MAKPRSLVADYGAYLLVRLLVCVVQALPLEMGRGIAAALARLAFAVDRRHREVALDNLRKAFPGRYSEAESHSLVLAVYRHFATLVIEIMHLPRKLHPSNWRKYATVSGMPLLADVLNADRPVLIVTGHFGNWEMAGYTLAMFGFKSYAVARPLDNPYLDRFLRKFREKTGQKLLAKKGDFDRMEEILRNRGIICTLGDQDAGQKGLYVQFFGRPASTHKAIALLAIEHRTTLVVAGAYKTGEPLRYDICVTDVIHPEDVDAMPSPVRGLTQRFTTAFENMVRLDPEQYLWLHRRWKHQPQRPQRKAA